MLLQTKTMRISYLQGILLLSLLFGGSDAIYKRWLKNTDFENPLNWNVKPARAPCGNDRVIIPDDSPVVYLQMNTTLQELTLPKSGEIILGSNIQLGFTQGSSPDCPSAGGDVEFTAVHPSNWLDPENWCSTNTELADCLPNSPIDTENVPCVHDDVVFQRYRSYYVTLGSNLQLKVKTLKILGTSFTTSSFAQYISSTDGGKMFKASGSPSSVTITRQACRDIGGCSCGNDQGKIQQAICDIRNTRCERSPCQYPVTPVGACCDMCGVVLNGTKGRGFNLNAFKAKLKSLFFNSYPNVTTAVSITGAGLVQVVLKDQDDGDGTDSARLAALLVADVKADLRKGGHKYALDAITLLANSAAQSSAHSGGGGGSTPLEGGSIAGIVIGLIFLILVIVIIVLIVIRGRPSMPRLQDWGEQLSRNFSRFRPMREPPSGSATPPRTLGPLEFDAGFPNPLYDSAPFDDGNAREMELRSPVEQPTFDIGGTDSGFNNPLYGATPGAFLKDATDTSVEGETETPKDKK